MSSVGVVIVTHGPAGGDMLATVGRMLGPSAIEGMVAVEVPVNGTKADVQTRLDEAVKEVNAGAGVVVCCDLHGSTPANCAVDLMRVRMPGVPLAVISGVSMPMLMKLATAQREGTTPAGLAKAAVDTAIRSTRIEGSE